MGDRAMTLETRRTTGGLGRGLAALIPEPATDEQPRDIALRDIARNPYQPRGRFEQEELEQLAASVAQHGVLQPILVTPTEAGFQLIAGERRLRAAEMAGLERIPAVVRAADQQQQLAFALVENIQRADLNPMDEARAFRQLIDEFGLTQEDVASRIGRSRPAIANTLRLLDVSPTLQAAVEDGTVTEGHARAIAGLDDHPTQDEVLAIVAARGLSVRETERLVRGLRTDPDGSAKPSRQATVPDPDTERIEAGLRTALATRVTINPGQRGGRITITYYDADDLARLYERLTGGEQ
jgi:ParB family transcriptional regulator, chromosome partitioning protein